MPKLLDETALGNRPLPEPAGGIARYRAEIPDAEAPGVALMAAGRQMGSDADKIFEAYKHEQAKVDTLRAEDAYTQLQNEKLKRTYGPGGYATRRGENAVLGPTIETEMSSFDDVIRKIGDGLANDDQKRMFQHRAMIGRNEYQEGNLRHRFQERNVWATDVTNSGVDSALANISAIYSNPNMDPLLAANQSSAELVRARSLIMAHADDLGMSKTKVDETMTKVSDQAITKKLLGWSSWDPVGAFENFKAHQTELSDPAHRLTLRNTLWERALPVQVGVEATGLIDKARRETEPKGGPTQGEDTFQSAVGSLLKREGGYVAKDGKSGAPANFGINAKANPDIDVKNLTQAGAVEIYRKRYWNAIGGDDLAPATALIALDTAALQGPGVAKSILTATGGDPQAMIDASRQRLQALAARDPEQAKYLPQWMARLDSLQAEVATMPDGGLRKVSATDRAMLPNTSPLPTARNIAAQLPIALMGVEKRATELFGPNRSDPDRAAFVVRLEQELRARNVHDTQLVQNQQREALQTVGNIILGPVLAPGAAPAQGGMVPAGSAPGSAGSARAMQKVTSFSELMANPVAAAEYQKLDFDGKRAVDTMIKVNANQSEHGDPALFNELRNKIASGEINWNDQITKDARVQQGNLNIAQLNFLRGELDRASTEDGRTQGALVKMGTKIARGIFQGDAILTSAGTDKGKAEVAEELFSRNAAKTVAQYRAAGKDVSELFDITNPKSLIYPPNLEQWKILAKSPGTSADMLAQMAATARAGGAPAAAAPAVAPVPAPATLKTAADVTAWVSTLPANVTHFTDPSGTVRAIPGRVVAPAAAAVGVPADQLRADGTTKGPGFLGPLPFKDGRTSTEISIGVKVNGKEMEIPSLVPTLTKPEIDSLLKGERPSDAIVAKAVAHAEQRIKDGKSVFAQAGETPAVTAAAAVKPKGAVPEFGGSINDKSPEYQAQHVTELDMGAMGHALKETGMAALHALNPMTAGRQIMDLYFSGVEKLRELPPAMRRESARAYFDDVLKKSQFFKEDVPAIQEALKYADLSVAERKKAKAMLKAAGAD